MSNILMKLVFVPVIAISGCGLNDMIEQSKSIQSIAFENCGCDDVKLISYSVDNFRTTVDMEVIGAVDSLHENVAMRINEGLKQEIKDYCKIDKVNLDFINKGKHHLISIRYCKIDNDN